MADVSLHERRRADRMQDPGYRAAYERAACELARERQEKVAEDKRGRDKRDGSGKPSKFRKLLTGGRAGRAPRRKLKESPAQGSGQAQSKRKPGK